MTTQQCSKPGSRQTMQTWYRHRQHVNSWACQWLPLGLRTAFSYAWVMPWVNHPLHSAPHICHSSLLDAPNGDKSNSGALSGTLHFKPPGCWPLDGTCFCLFNEDRRLLASSLLNGHLFFMAVTLHSPAPPPPPLTSLGPAGSVSGQSHDFSANICEWQTKRKETH